VETKVLDAIAQVLAGSAVRARETADAEPAPAAPRPRRAGKVRGG